MPKKKSYDIWRKRLENLEKREGYAGLVKNRTGRDIFGNIPLKGTSNAKIEGTSDYGLYYDQKGLLTTGIGHLVKPDENPENYYQMSKEQARELKEKDLKSHDKDATSLLIDKGIDPSKLGPYQLDAVKDFVYQLGKTKASKFKNSFKKLKRAVESGNKSDMEAAVNEFGDSGWARQTPVRYEDFKARMLEPVETEQYGPSNEELISQPVQRELASSQPQSADRGLGLEDKLAMYAQMNPEANNIKEQVQAVDEEISGNNQIDMAKRIAMNDGGINRLMGAGPTGKIKSETEKEIDEAKKQIVQKGIGDKLVNENPQAVAQVVDTVVDDPKTKQDIITDVALKSSGNNKARDPLSAQFTEALTYFLPTVIGGIGGALFEGTEGALSGMEAGTTIGKDMRDYGLQRDRLAMQQQQMQLSQQNQAGARLGDFVDSDTGKPLQFDFQSGNFLNANGKQVDPKKAIDKTVYNTRYREQGTQGRFGIRQDLKASERIETSLKDFRKENQKLVDARDTIEPVLNMLQSGMPVSSDFLTPFVARGIQNEVGNLSETDLAKARVPLSVARRLQSDVKGYLTGNMSDEERKVMLRMISYIQDQKSEQLRKKADNFASPERAKRLDIDREKYKKQIERDFGVLKEDKKESKSGSLMTDDQRKRLEELRAKRAKGQL